MTTRITLEMVGDNAAPVIEKAIAGLSDGSELLFEKGMYPLSQAIHIQGKRRLTLKGNGCTFAPLFDREATVEHNAEVFHFHDCQDVVLQDFDISSPMPVNSAGTIVHVAPEYADVQVNSRVPFTGKEQFISGMTYDEDGLPTYHYWLKTQSDPALRTVIADEIVCTNPRELNVPHEMIGDQLIRVWSNALDGLKAGMRCSISHSYYGLAACIFRQCERFTFEHVSISNYGGFGFVILPRCRDFVFRRLRLSSADPLHQPFALNSDGIHLTGLSGKLLLEDCQFDSIGDDLINIHTQVMTVQQRDDRSMRLIYDKPHGVISPYWVMPGDVLHVYNPVSLALRAKVTVKACDQEHILFEESNPDIQAGDYVTNQTYFPDVVIHRCNVKNYRGRAFCIQSPNSLLIEDCTFSGATHAALYCSTAFDKWMEAGPLRNVTLRRNHFYGNGQWHNPAEGVVWVRVNGERHQNIAPIHRSIAIVQNTFEHIGGPSIVINLTDGVQVTDNVFTHCSPDYPPITIDRCTHVQCANNHSIEPSIQWGTNPCGKQ